MIFCKHCKGSGFMGYLGPCPNCGGTGWANTAWMDVVLLVSVFFGGLSGLWVVYGLL